MAIKNTIKLQYLGEHSQIEQKVEHISALSDGELSTKGVLEERSSETIEQGGEPAELLKNGDIVLVIDKSGVVLEKLDCFDG